MPNAYGRLPHTDDPRDWHARATRPYTGAYVDLTMGFPAVWDQGQLGACVEFGSCAALCYARNKAGLDPIDPSPLFGYFAARARAGYDTNQDTGLEIRDGINSLAKDGIPPAVDWPYVVEDFAEVPPRRAYQDAGTDEATVYGAVDPAGVDAMIASGYPVVIGFDVYSSFESDATASTGVMSVPGPGEELLGGHCVVLCSTPRDGKDIPGGIPGVQYRRARNSWGSSWRDGGYFWFPVPAMVHASDFWQVTTVSAPGPTPTPPTPPTPAVRYRVGTHLGRTIYRDDHLIGVMDHRRDAVHIVDLLNKEGSS